MPKFGPADAHVTCDVRINYELTVLGDIFYLLFNDLRTILKIGDCRVVPELHLLVAPLRDVLYKPCVFTRPSFGGSGYETTGILVS